MREIEKNTMCYDGAALKPVLRYIDFCKKYEFVFFEWLPIAFVSFMSDVEKLKNSFFLLTTDFSRSRRRKEVGESVFRGEKHF